MHKTEAETLRAALIAHETRVWDALVTGDAAADADLLCDSFWGVYSDGVAGKSDHVGQLANGPTIATFTLMDCRVRPMGPAHALLTYQAHFTRHGYTQGETMFVSSIWHRRGDGWTNIFSQDTPAHKS